MSKYTFFRANHGDMSDNLATINQLKEFADNVLNQLTQDVAYGESAPIWYNTVTGGIVSPDRVVQWLDQGMKPNITVSTNLVVVPTEWKKTEDTEAGIIKLPSMSFNVDLTYEMLSDELTTDLDQFKLIELSFKLPKYMKFNSSQRKVLEHAITTDELFRVSLFEGVQPTLVYTNNIRID